MADAELTSALRAAVAGDAGEFARLWRSLQPPLLRYLRVVCDDAADDIASETWIRVASDLPGFIGDATAFRVWVFRIARHRGLNHHRLTARRREMPTGSEFDADDQRVRDVAFDAIEHADTEWALRLIASLPAAESEAVMLRVVVGLDVSQTAQVLEKQPGAVRIATMRGLRRLSAHPEVLARRPFANAAVANAVTQPEGV